MTENEAMVPAEAISDNFSERVAWLYTTAKHICEHVGEEVEPMFVMIERGGEKVCMIAIGGLINNSDFKDHLARVMQIAVEPGSPCEMAGMISETWMWRAPPGASEEEIKRIPPRQRPDRKEGLMINLLDETHQCVASATIDRNPNRMGPLFRLKPGSYSGRFLRGSEEDFVAKSIAKRLLAAFEQQLREGRDEPA